MNGGIHILGEPTYRLVQRFSKTAQNTGSAAVGYNPGLTFNWGALMPAALQQTQALRLVSGWCILNNFDGLIPGSLVPVNFLVQVQFGGNTIRVYLPPVVSNNISIAGPAIGIKGDEFLLGSDLGETGGISNAPLNISAVADINNTTAAPHNVIAFSQFIFELYNREAGLLVPKATLRTLREIDA